MVPARKINHFFVDSNVNKKNSLFHSSTILKKIDFDFY